VRYIDTYRDPRAEVEEEENGDDKKRPWWKFGSAKDGKKSLSDFVTPDDWLKTHITDGLDSMEVERRRRYTGWNELTTEKENMFLKFIGFFRGPILYGRLPCRASISGLTADTGKQSWKPLQCSHSVCGTGSMPALSAVFSCSTQWSDGTRSPEHLDPKLPQLQVREF
jgi:magnesium-transporting ATPase (P-type)